MTTSRRRFIQTLAVSTVAAPLLGPRILAQSSLKFPVPGVLGLELYSVRHLMPKDVDGTLKLVRNWGFRDVEGGPFQEMSAADTRALLDKHGLRMQSTLTGYERLRDDLAGVIADAKALGATLVGTAWIPHQGSFGQSHTDAAVADFSKWAPALKKEGLTFFYHVHGYEFQPSADGTLMDTLVTKTPADVLFQADIFWVKRGGGDPAGLLRKYSGRFKSLHLKDMAKGTATGDPTGSAPDEACVVFGTGQIDFPAVLKAAKESGVTHYYIEDEHPEAEKQIPKSLEYLAGLSI
jgi:sugar phosphate isomerase/epimerase